MVVELLLFPNLPVAGFAVGRAYDVGLGYVGTQYSLGALELQRHVFYDYNTKSVHLRIYITC